MSGVEVHLWFNHVPVLGVLFGLVLFVAGLARRSSDLQKAALVTFLLAGLVAVPVYFSGESAEHVVEHLPGVTHDSIEAHEDAGKAAFFGLLALALAGAVGLVVSRGDAAPARWLTVVVVIVALVVGAITFRAAHLGGQIRHPELNDTR